MQPVPDNPKKPIKGNLCHSLKAAEAYTGESERRLRHLIANHGFPMKKKGGRYQGFYSEIDRWYAEDLG